LGTEQKYSFDSIRHLIRKLTGKSFYPYLPFVVLIVGFLLTTLGTLTYWQATNHFDFERFEYNVEQKRAIIGSQLTVYQTLLRGAAGSIAADNSFNHKSFRGYVEQLDLSLNYPGVAGIGYVQIVPADELKDLEAVVSADPGFEILSVETREGQDPFIFIGPVLPESSLYRLQEFISKAGTREAMERARDTGLPAATRVVRSALEGEQTFVIFVPIYADSGKPDTLPERREDIKGYTYSVISVNSFFEDLFKTGGVSRVVFSVFEGSHKSSTLIYGELPQELLGAKFEGARTIDTMGHRWIIFFRSGPDFRSTFSYIGALYLTLTGLILTLLLAGYLRSQVFARRRIEEQSERFEKLVEERTKELVDTHERLRVTERMAALGTLSAGIGHDLGNLLLPIRLRLDRLSLKKFDDKELLDDVHAIRQSTQYLSRLVQSLKLLSVDAASDKTSDLIDLSVWWSEVEVLLRTSLPKNVILKHSFQPDLPFLNLSHASLTQAVFNLVQNAGAALKHSTDGGIVEVLGFFLSEQEIVQIIVKDNGPGMSPEVMRRCREPFFSTKTRDLSTGLGLSLVQGIVTGAGGAVDIKSEQGKGAQFILSFPYSKEVKADGQNIEKLATVSIKDKRIAGLLFTLLKNSGYKVDFSIVPHRDSLLWVPALETEKDELSTYIASSRKRKILYFGSSELEEEALVKLDGFAPSKIRSALREAVN